MSKSATRDKLRLAVSGEKSPALSQTRKYMGMGLDNTCQEASVDNQDGSYL